MYPLQRPEAPARIARSSGFYHHYHINKMENLVPAVLRGAAQSIHYEKQEADVKQVAVQADPQQVPAVPSDEVAEI